MEIIVRVNTCDLSRFLVLLHLSRIGVFSSFPSKFSSDSPEAESESTKVSITSSSDFL
ncbi:unnamed protein product [Brassica oleracea var. botrytis]|uniref:(rape) hypothetical protein n=1 Tax=Brassica napus TaxID=3708 RepID=A0A816J9F5_BRANA|nr:unnamed protein product [Brassica napus]